MGSKLIRERIGSAHVISIAALFVALGGTALALSKDSVRSKHIKDGQVRSADIKNDGVKSKDIKDGQLEDADVKPDKLTGDSILESSLGQVPAAGNSDRVDGVHAKSFRFRVSAGTAETTVLSFGDLQIKAACDAGPDLEVWIETLRNDSAVTYLTHNGLAGLTDLDASEVLGFSDANESGSAGVISFSSPAGAIVSDFGDNVTVTFQMREGSSQSDCLFNGTAHGSLSGLSFIPIRDRADYAKAK